jgi:hypothetical protein
MCPVKLRRERQAGFISPILPTQQSQFLYLGFISSDYTKAEICSWISKPSKSALFSPQNSHHFSAKVNGYSTTMEGAAMGNKSIS